MYNQGSNGIYPLYIYAYYYLQLIINIDCTAREKFYKYYRDLLNQKLNCKQICNLCEEYMFFKVVYMDIPPLYFYTFHVGRYLGYFLVCYTNFSLRDNKVNIYSVISLIIAKLKEFLIQLTFIWSIFGFLDLCIVCVL